MKVDTTTILLIGVAAVAVYFITRPAPVVTPVMPVYNPGYSPYAGYGVPQANQTAADIAAGGAAAASILSVISNISSS
jgi:hypothetical protein